MKRRFLIIKNMILAVVICASCAAYAASPGSHLPVDVAAQGSFIYPMGDLGDMFKYGTGGTLAVSWRDAFFPGFTLGLKQGNWYFGGAESEVNWGYIAGLSASAGYSINIGDFAITPGFSIGYTYTSLSYRRYLSGLDTSYNDRVERGFDPLFTGGIAASYTGFTPLILTLGADYGMIIEQSGLMHYVSGMLGAGLRL